MRDGTASRSGLWAPSWRFHVKHEARALRISETLSEDVVCKLKKYVRLLARWNNVTNLTAADSFDRLWDRHIEDSIYIQKSCPTARLWLDVGSGAGFPAIVIASILSEADGARVHCVESDGRKCAFLRVVADRLKIPVKVHQARIETLSPDAAPRVEVVTARAFSSLRQTLTATKRYLDQGAIAILPRGRSALSEVVDLDSSGYTITIKPNPNHSDGVILHVENRDREL